VKKIFFPVLVALIEVLVLSAAQLSADGGDTPYYRSRTVILGDSVLVDQSIIKGPPSPPPGYELERAPAALASPNIVTGSNVLTVPAYDWSFGCSATSGAMIAGYYDRTGYPNMYTGPTNSGVMPLDSSPWPNWTDGQGDTYGQCPLIASRVGLDGRETRGSMEDYWVGYLSSVQDPYLTNGWTQHALGDAIGDYMRTSQSAYSNVDGSTVFYNWTSLKTPLTCADMVSYGVTQDGTYGRKLFYEARGYTVTDCYNQKTDNNGGGFTFALYKAEIDAGRPAMLNLAGHTVVGVGYDDASNTVYIHDTWDFATHTMTWGGSYAGMALQSVSIVNLLCPTPAAVSNLTIARGDSMQTELTWNAVTGADHYEIWSAVSVPYFTPGADCVHSDPFRCADAAGTIFEDESLGGSTGSRTYVARAVSACGAVSPLGSQRVGVFEYEVVPGN